VLDELEPLLTGIGSEVNRPDVAEAVTALAHAWPDGRVKLYVTAAGLRLRRAHPEVFLAGGYHPLDCDMTPPAGVVAFARVHGDRVVVAVAPRLVAQFGFPVDGTLRPDIWQGARLRLPDDLQTDEFVDVLTGRRHAADRDASGHAGLALGRLLGTLPVALLWGKRKS
jgi:(1->4)-alpha-D-glucan 1-alpha-D-glucosylmutase